MGYFYFAAEGTNVVGAQAPRLTLAKLSLLSSAGFGVDLLIVVVYYFITTWNSFL